MRLQFSLAMLLAGVTAFGVGGGIARIPVRETLFKRPPPHHEFIEDRFGAVIYYIGRAKMNPDSLKVTVWRTPTTRTWGGV